MIEPESIALGTIVRQTGGFIQTGPFGSQLHASDYTTDGTPLVMPTNIGDNTIDEDGIARIGEKDVRRLSRHQLRAGDIVFGRRGDIGRRAIVRSAQVGWLCGTGCLAVRFGKVLSQVNPEYVALYVGTALPLRWLVDNAVGGTMANLNTQILGSLPVMLPAKTEQDHVAAAIDDVSTLIASLERLIAKKRAIKHGMMQEVFHRAGTAPLGSIASFLSGGTPNRSNAEYWSGTIPWISATTLKNMEVSTSDQHVTTKAVAAGSKMAPLHSTLLLVRGSALHSQIRASLVVAPVCFNQDVKALVPSGAVVPKFLTYSIHANADRLLRLVTSAGNTAGVLDTRVLKVLKLWLPSRAEQARVVETFDDVTAEITALERRLEGTRAIKQGMMQELLTGRTRLPVDGVSL